MGRTVRSPSIVRESPTSAQPDPLASDSEASNHHGTRTNKKVAYEKRIALNASVCVVSAVSTGRRSIEEAP